MRCSSAHRQCLWSADASDLCAARACPWNEATPAAGINILLLPVDYCGGERSGNKAEKPPVRSNRESRGRLG
jgi:hypothetical protein